MVAEVDPFLRQNHVGIQDAYRISIPEDRREVMGLVYMLHQDREVRLPPGQDRQPGAKPLRLAHGADFLDHPDANLLQNIVKFIGVAYDAVDQSSQPLPVKNQQRLQRLLITAASGTNQSRFVLPFSRRHV